MRHGPSALMRQPHIFHKRRAKVSVKNPDPMGQDSLRYAEFKKILTLLAKIGNLLFRLLDQKYDLGTPPWPLQLYFHVPYTGIV